MGRGLFPPRGAVPSGDAGGARCARLGVRRRRGVRTMIPQLCESMHYDREGNPISLETWGKLLEDPSYKRLASHQLSHVTVSTVWLGLDHSWGAGPPVIFETMVFGGPDNSYQERYRTELDARLGHLRTLVMTAQKLEQLTRRRRDRLRRAYNVFRRAPSEP